MFRLSHHNYLEQLNPLRNLTPAQAVSLIEAGMRGQFTLLQWYYNTIEQADPDLMALVERRTGAIAEMDWDVKTSAKPVTSEQKSVSSGQAAAAEDPQMQTLREAYERIENLQEAITHLALATFRGYSIGQLKDAKGRPAAPGAATRIECIPHWNLVRDGRAGAWKYNPDALQVDFDNLPEENRLDPARDCLLIREVARPVDRIGLVKFIRSNYTQKAWSEFVEKCAQDGVFIILPPNIPNDQKEEYINLAAAAASGGNAVLPNGADAKFANALRGETPFEAHMRFLREQMVLAGTGGLLTMLAEPTGIGQGATGAHADAFQTLARAEARAISETFQRGFDKPLLANAYAGVKPTAYWQLAYADEIDVGLIIDQAVKLAQVFELDPAQFSEKTGYTLTRKSIPAAPSFSTSGRADFPGLTNRAAATHQPFSLAARAGAFANREDGPAGPLLATARLQLAEAQRKALAPLAERIQALYAEADNLTDAELTARLEALRAELPALLKEMNADPETSAVMEQALAAALANGIASAAEEVRGQKSEVRDQKSEVRQSEGDE